MFSGILPTKASNPIPSKVVKSSGSGNADLLAQYRVAKDFFYRKQYHEATSLFTQLIENNPGTLFLYDGLARVYGARQNILQSIELYKNGIQQNTGNPYFLHRYGMALRNLCLGNPASARQFAEKNKILNLYQYAVEQVLASIAISPKTIFILDVKDFPRLLEKFNANSRNSEISLPLPDDILLQISSFDSSVSEKWINTRRSRKPTIHAELEEDSSQTGIKPAKKRHRNLYNDKEIKEREKSEKKHKKRVSYFNLRQVYKQKNTGKIEHFGMQILANDFGDTNIVGLMRNYFKRKKHYDRNVSLNRYFYAANQNIFSGLALAGSLVKYSKNTPSINEAKQILDFSEPYLQTLTPVARASWFLTSAKILQNNKKQQEVQDTLLNGLKQSGKCNGVLYTLMEHYIMTFDKKDAKKAIEIQKALCNKKVQQQNDPVWMYVEQYQKFINENPVSVSEQIKALYALAKLQKNFKDNGYYATIMEIETLKKSLT